MRALVLGAAAIAVAAIYEARTNYDVFDHLHKWFSFFEPTRAIKESAKRGTRLRVRASAQHPIALGAALTMALPLAAYLATRARNQARRLLLGRGRRALRRRRADDGLADGRPDGGRR